MGCPTCCYSCLLNPSGSETSSAVEAPLNDAAEDISHLLPAGAIKLPVEFAESAHWCRHAHAEDGWHPFGTNFMLPQILALDLKLEDTSTLQQLKYLISHDYVRCTYQHDDFSSSVREITSHINLAQHFVQLHVRVYMVPFDLPGVNPARIRDKKPFAHGPKTLRSILKLASNNVDLWNGPYQDGSSATATNPMAILPETTVCELRNVYCQLFKMRYS